MLSSSQPVLILTVTGMLTAFFTDSTIFAARIGSFISALPPPEDIATFERLAGVDRNLAQKLFDLLDELLRKAGWDNNANVALDSLFGDINPQRLQSVRNSWAQALQNADAGAAGVGEAQNSVEFDTRGKPYVVIY